MKLKLSALALILAVAGCMTSAFAQVTYNFEDVQYKNGGTTDTFTQFLGINNSNLVAGYHNVNANKGFIYDVATKSFVDENFPGAAQTQVIGINNGGKTVGFYITPGGKTVGFEYINAVFTTELFPGTAFNQLLGQNDLGQSAGYYSNNLGGTLPDHAYILDEVGQAFETFTIPNSPGGAQATGVNNAGNVCGFYVDSKGVNHGWLQTAGIFLTLNYPKSTFTQALGLNNKGQVVGQWMDSVGNTHGFVYTVSTKKYENIENPNGANTTVVNGINDNGVLVGFYGTLPINTGFVATPAP